MENASDEFDGFDQSAAVDVCHDGEEERRPHYQSGVPALRDVKRIVDDDYTLNLAAGEVWTQSCCGEPGEDGNPACTQCLVGR